MREPVFPPTPRPPKVNLKIEAINYSMAVKFELPVTQTSTIVAILCSLFGAVAFTSLGFGDGGMGVVGGGTLRLVHLGAFSTWLGVQVWVTFVAGKYAG
jgi:hypothetical protein